MEAKTRNLITFAWTSLVLFSSPLVTVQAQSTNKVSVDEAKQIAVDKHSGQFPASDGPIYLVMRLYWPKTEAPSVLPAGEGTWKPPSIVKAN